ncbi:MAG: glycolate oxidase subunit GlcF [Candidatus Eutrophobiaceae bacterium]
MHLDSDNSDPKIQEAKQIVRSCVHCGFCTAHCPTYQLLGDDADSPRGRIYLIKAMLEGEKTSAKTRLHLDRCLLCRACETVCPSGVRYGDLLEIGRAVAEEKVPRRPWDKLYRWVIEQILPYPKRLQPLWKWALRARPALPRALKRMIPLPREQIGSAGSDDLPRRMLLAGGCVQSVLSPEINLASQAVLARIGIECAAPAPETCCGALDFHAGKIEVAKRMARGNIDVWWRAMEADQRGAEAIISTASGCGAHLKEYGKLLQGDPKYAEKAARIGGMVRDLSEVFGEEETQRLKAQLQPCAQRVAVQCPCTLQHAQRLPDALPKLFTALDWEQVPTDNPAQCCGSAGAYSLLQPSIARQLRARKLHDLTIHQPDCIVTANIGCLHHLRERRYTCAALSKTAYALLKPHPRSVPQ